MPKDGKSHVKLLVECAKEDPARQFILGMTYVYPDLQHEDGKVQASAINALVTGICLAEAWRKHGDGVEKSLLGYLEHVKRTRGENVLNFFVERAKLND